jgi:hypothetical protein
MNPRRRVLAFTTSSGGAATVKDIVPFSGRIIAVQYIPDGTSPPSDNVTLVLTSIADDGGIQSLLTTGAIADGDVQSSWAPRQPVCGPTAVASLYAANGTAVQDKFVVADELFQIVIASGGNATKGKVAIILE